MEVEAEIGMLRLGARWNRGQGGKDLPRASPGAAARDTRWRTCGLHSLEGNISVILSLPVCGHLRW